MLLESEEKPISQTDVLFENFKIDIHIERIKG